MKQTYVQKTTNVRRLSKEGVWEVQSSRHPQLWHKIILDMDNDKIHCGCPAWKYHSCEGVCRHIMAVVEKEVKV